MTPIRRGTAQRLGIRQPLSPRPVAHTVAQFMAGIEAMREAFKAHALAVGPIFDPARRKP